MNNRVYLVILAVIMISGILFFINKTDNEESSESHNESAGGHSDAIRSSNDKHNADSSNDETKKPINHENVIEKVIKPKEKTSEEVAAESGGSPHSIDKKKSNEDLKDAGDKYKVEITLIDNETNKPIVDYDVEAKLGYYKYNDGDYQVYGIFKKLKSESNGRIFLTTSHIGRNTISILTKDFAIFKMQVTVRNKNNKISVRLIRGGTLIVKAVNEFKKNVEGLKASLFIDYDRFEIEPQIQFDAIKGEYILSNLPINILGIYFKAEGYQNTKDYQITIEPMQTTTLHVQLHPIRKIYFETENKVKPEFIKISIKHLNDQYGFRSRNKKDTTVRLINNGYEFTIENQEVNTVILFAENYIPLEIKLSPTETKYKIKFVEGLKLDIVVNDESGKHIPNLKITYSVNVYSGEVFTNEKGQATITCLSDNENISIWFHLKGFKSIRDNWIYNMQTGKSKLYTLKRQIGISGKVKFGELPINEARVIFEQKQSMMSSSSDLITDIEGNYVVENIMEDCDSFTLKAFHIDYGASITHAINWEGKALVVDLNLIKDKNKTVVKLIDEFNFSIPNTDIIVECNEHYIREMVSTVITTDERGECELLNVIPSTYYFQLQEGKYYFKDNGVNQLPKDEVVLIAKNKDLRKISVIDSTNALYTGFLYCSVERNKHVSPCEILFFENGFKYLNFSELSRYSSKGPFSLIFEVPGYGSVRVGPYEEEDDCPLELKINLPVNHETKLKVVGSIDNLPIPYAMITINNFGSASIKKYQTNEAGEIFVNFLNGKFKVESNIEGYAPYLHEFDTNSGKEFLIKVSKGGSLRVHLSLSNTESASISLYPSDKNARLDSKGNAEILNLMAGEYSLTINKNFGKDWANITIPKPINIEDDKTLELNLDDLIKKLTSLEIIMLKDGVRSNENGILSIDRGAISIGEESKMENGSQVFELIFPGRRGVSYQYLQNRLSLNVDILLNQKNILELHLPCANLTVIAKNEEGKVLSNIYAKLNFGVKYRTEEQLDGGFTSNDPVAFNLFPKLPHCLLLEGDSTTNYEMKVVTPINLDIGQQQKLEIIMTTGRKLPNIQIVDASGNSLEKVGFGITDEKGNFMRRTHQEELKFYPYSNAKGFLPENGWPKSKFTLIVSKKGYGYQEVDIAEDIDSEQVMQIKLHKGSSINCVFPQPLDYPISVGILRSNGELLRKPIDYGAFSSSTFFPDKTNGNVTIQDLKAGTYYIGYFWNYAPTKLIARQGPFQLSEGQNIEVISNLVFE